MILRGTLAKYLRPGAVFVETGTREGNTVAMALGLGAERVISVENQAHLHEAAVRRFADDLRVKIHLGRSVDMLERVLPELAAPAVFWLDAHTTGQASPLLEELQALWQDHTRRGAGALGHTVLIDDVRCYRKREWGISLAQVVDAALAVNPAYRLGMEDGYEPWDIMVAKAF